jgi:hypothetical protein
MDYTFSLEYEEKPMVEALHSTRGLPTGIGFTVQQPGSVTGAQHG